MTIDSVTSLHPIYAKHSTLQTVQLFTIYCMISTVRLIKTEVLLRNLCDGDFSLESGTNELAAVLRKRHQILSLNEHHETCRRTYFGDVLVLLHVGDQRQTYTQ